MQPFVSSDRRTNIAGTGSSHPPYHKTYRKDNGEATIVCMSCGRTKVVHIPRPGSPRQHLKVKCLCTNLFSVVVESRTCYRKRVRLYGMYWNLAQEQDSGEILVESLSRTGVGFTTNLAHRIRVGDPLRIVFVLDNPRQTRVSKRIVIRHIHGRCVGAEFCDPPEFAFGFYLMP